MIGDVLIVLGLIIAPIPTGTAAAVAAAAWLDLRDTRRRVS